MQTAVYFFILLRIISSVSFAWVYAASGEVDRNCIFCPSIDSHSYLPSCTQTRKPSASDDAHHVEDKTAGILVMLGMHLTEKGAQELEYQLLTQSDKLDLHTQLLCYYYFQHTVYARHANERHALWIIQNCPWAAIAGTPFVSFSTSMKDPIYEEAKSSWLKAIVTYPKNFHVIENAAMFFSINEDSLSETFLTKALSLSQDKCTLLTKLGDLFDLLMISSNGSARQRDARQALSQYEQALLLTKDRETEISLLISAAKAAVNANDIFKSREYANLLLSKSSGRRPGGTEAEAIHWGHIILGKLALKSQNADLAKIYLLRASKIEGSSILNSFVPDLALARKLLDKGETQTVITYLQECSLFWNSGKADVQLWISEIRQGRNPIFELNLDE